ncbi:hypothetical protein NP493_347g02031 [Ridgeia piscesae]|uniref:Uncharacterized protein n=1 Tax=Ridgeia piscesae TaxID=27915 RepID=A0AAD9NVL0_RIDPI|nr:hypothetical protein NP493_347g02031 [Ridgeia piscesae]
MYFHGTRVTPIVTSLATPLSLVRKDSAMAAQKVTRSTNEASSTNILSFVDMRIATTVSCVCEGRPTSIYTHCGHFRSCLSPQLV